MEIKIIELKEIKAEEGMVLTNGKTFSDPGEKIYLGINDNPDNWWEVTEEAAVEMKAELEKTSTCRRSFRDYERKRRGGNGE